MDLPTDHDTATYYEEVSIEDRASIKAALPLKPFYDELAINFETQEGLSYQESTEVSRKEYTVVLYMRPSCPYCRKVMKYLDSIGETIPMKDIGKDSGAREELIRVGGKKQVPCLFINGKAHYESNWIMNWLGKHQGQY